MGVGTNKFNFGGGNIFDRTPKEDTIYIGEVISVSDAYDGNRIKVRIKGFDDKTPSDELPYAFPFLPKFLNIVPNIGESVFILLLRQENKYQNRLWLGPIISQPQKLNNDPHNFSSRSLITAGIKEPEQAPSTLPESKGVYPSDKGYFLKENVALQGRDNSDLIFKKNEIVLRAGKFEVNNKLKFNKKNIGYIQIKHDVIIDSEKKTKGTVTNIVSDKINLLSHSGIPRFTLTNQDTLISDGELAKILEKAHQLVYGDVLVEFLNLIKNFVVNHSHPYAGLPPVDDLSVKNVRTFPLNTLLSDNIRIS